VEDENAILETSTAKGYPEDSGFGKDPRCCDRAKDIQEDLLCGDDVWEALFFQSDLWRLLQKT
tara:strand:- start:402 stop:590 length:189 start_codon:yes stop_codon:yes gene_type:complete